MSENGKKVPHGLMVALTDGKVWAAFFTCISVWVAIFMAPKDLPAEKRQNLIEGGIYATSGVVAAALVAMGYQKGKMLEGTVPEGYESVNKPQQPAAPVTVLPPATVISQGQTTLTPGPINQLPNDIYPQQATVSELLGKQEQ